MIWLATYPYVLFAALLGTCIASFACVVIERGGRDESLGGRSHCICGRQLKNRENLPIIGWLLCFGKARCCGARIPAWYVLAELFGAVSWGAAGFLGLPGIVMMVLLTVVVVGIAKSALESTRSKQS